MNTQSNEIFSKRKLLESEAQWMERLREEWCPFAVTTVFKAGGVKPRPDRWLDEYKHKVVWKVNKRIARHARELIVVWELDCYYEFNESSLQKCFGDKRQPHHVHSVLLVPKNKSGCVWNEAENRLNSRLEKDFKSIKNVSSILMEPLQVGKSIEWLTYCAKGKPFNIH